jgi:Predicted glycosyltransferases
VKTLIAVPCMDMLHTAFFASAMRMNRVGDCEVRVTASSLVYDARNQLARFAIDNGFDRVLWLDSDMEFQPDMMEKLSAHIDDGAEIVSGLYFTRRAPVKPVVYQEVGAKPMGSGTMLPFADSYMDYPENSYFEVAGVGFGCCMTTVELLKKVQERYGLPFSPILGFGEDLSFCIRVKELGVPMYCDSSVKCGHVGLITFAEELYKETRQN